MARWSRPTIANLPAIEAAERAIETRDQACEAARQKRAYHRREPIVDIYLERGNISKSQHRAATTLRSDWERSGLDPWSHGLGAVVHVSGQHMPGCGPRYTEYTAAVRSLGPILIRPILSIVIWDKPADQWAREQGLPPTDGIALVRCGLEMLAAHYRQS